MKIDLNCDLGESFGNYTCGMDEQILPFITSANVACGFHASDPLVMAQTVAAAKTHGVAVGAHPGYPDLVGFGRRNLSVSTAELKAMVQYQIGALMAFSTASGLPLQHVKPHGAMYNMAAKDPSLATAICEAISDTAPELILLAPCGSQLLTAAKNTGLRAAIEVFADRAYNADLSLVPRSVPGSVITDEELAIRRVLAMVKEGTVETIDGKTVEIQAQSICVHGDNKKALCFVENIHRRLIDEQITLAPLSKIV